MTPIVNYSSATGQYSLIVVGAGNPSWIWSKWYQGPTEPAVLDPNPFVGTAAGSTNWLAQEANNGSQVFGPQSVKPSPNCGVKLVVWELQNDASTFAVASAWEPPHVQPNVSNSNPITSASASPSTSSPSSPPLNHQGGEMNRPSASPTKKPRRDDDVVPVDLVQE